MAQESQGNENDQLKTMMELFKISNPPTSEATQFMTTREIFEQFQEHYPGDYTTNDIASLLSDAGYHQDHNASGFVWLVSSSE